MKIKNQRKILSVGWFIISALALGNVALLLWRLKDSTTVGDFLANFIGAGVW